MAVGDYWMVWWDHGDPNQVRMGSPEANSYAQRGISIPDAMRMFGEKKIRALRKGIPKKMRQISD